MDLTRSIVIHKPLLPEVTNILMFAGIPFQDVNENDKIEIWEYSQLILLKVLRNGIVKITKRLEY